MKYGQTKLKKMEDNAKTGKFIDFRSDTSSLPTEKMRLAMKNAKLGNDAFGEDPTVNALQEKSAKVFKKDAGLLAVSGTMANLVSVMSLVKPGEGVIIGNSCHIMQFEFGNICSVAGVIPFCVGDKDGSPDLNEVEYILEKHKNVRIKLLCIENTHNFQGGRVIRPEYMKECSAVASKFGLKIFMDGARIFNASVALGIPANKLCENTDALMFCLSKSLCCPVGSVVVGGKRFIEKARLNRAIIGGQMRQAGIIASCGVVALNTTIERLKEDHDRAGKMAEGLSQIKGVKIANRVETNIVLVDFSETGMSADRIDSELKKMGVYTSVFTESVIRFITYRDITDKDARYAVECVKKTVG